MVDLFSLDSSVIVPVTAAFTGADLSTQTGTLGVYDGNMDMHSEEKVVSVQAVVMSLITNEQLCLANILTNGGEVAPQCKETNVDTQDKGGTDTTLLLQFTYDGNNGVSSMVALPHIHLGTKTPRVLNVVRLPVFDIYVAMCSIPKMYDIVSFNSMNALNSILDKGGTVISSFRDVETPSNNVIPMEVSSVTIVRQNAVGWVLHKVESYGHYPAILQLLQVGLSSSSSTTLLIYVASRIVVLSVLPYDIQYCSVHFLLLLKSEGLPTATVQANVTGLLVNQFYGKFVMGLHGPILLYSGFFMTGSWWHIVWAPYVTRTFVFTRWLIAWSSVFWLYIVRSIVPLSWRFETQVCQASIPQNKSKFLAHSVISSLNIALVTGALLIVLYSGLGSLCCGLLLHHVLSCDVGQIASVLAFALYTMCCGRSHGYFRVMVESGNVGNLRLSLELGYQVVYLSLVHDHKAHPLKALKTLAEVAKLLHQYCQVHSLIPNWVDLSPPSPISATTFSAAARSKFPQLLGPSAIGICFGGTRTLYVFHYSNNVCPVMGCIICFDPGGDTTILLYTSLFLRTSFTKLLLLR